MRQAARTSIDFTASRARSDDPGSLTRPSPSNDGELAIDVPQLCVTLTPNTAWDWNFTTVPQEGLNGRTPPFPRGIGLGGTSAVSTSLCAPSRATR